MTEPRQRHRTGRVDHSDDHRSIGITDEADATRDRYRHLPERPDLTRVVTTQASVPAGLLWLASGADLGGCDADD